MNIPTEPGIYAGECVEHEGQSVPIEALIVSNVGVIYLRRWVLPVGKDGFHQYSAEICLN